jgi:UDPglucose 6-dehydrogenase
MKIGIVGMGVVGATLERGFVHKGHEVYTNDVKPDIGNSTKEDLAKECDVVFICVDTPNNSQGCDLSHVYEAFNDLHYHIAQGMREKILDPPVIAIKSTVIPGTVDTLYSMYPYVCSNPEFLRAASAYHDFLNPDRIMVGAHSDEVFEVMKKVYESWNCPRFYSTPKTVELAKYISNAFLVSKVAFSQEVRSISELLGVSAEEVMQGVCYDHRINDSHLNPVKGKIPLDSMCLPKDMIALIMQCQKSQYNPFLLMSSAAKGIEKVHISTRLDLEVER